LNKDKEAEDYYDLSSEEMNVDVIGVE